MNAILAMYPKIEGWKTFPTIPVPMTAKPVMSDKPFAEESIFTVAVYAMAFDTVAAKLTMPFTRPTSLAYF